MFEKVGKSGYFEIYADSIMSQDGVRCVAVNKDGTLLYAAGLNKGVLYKINENTLTKITENLTDHPSSYIMQGQFHPQRNEIFLWYLQGPYPWKFNWVRYSYNTNTATITEIQRYISTSTTNWASTASIDAYGKFFYGLEADTAQIRRYDVLSDNGKLTLLGTAPVGNNSTFISCHPSGNFAYVSNFSDNTVQMYTVNSATGLLSSTGTISSGGTNPSSSVVHPSGNFLYVINEFTNNLQSYTINTTSGSLSLLQNINTDMLGVLNITCTPNGNFLYTTGTRVTLFTINQSSGILTYVESYNFDIAMPSSFGIVCNPNNSFLYVAVGTLNKINTYSINSTSGKLTFISNTLTGGIFARDIDCDPTGRFVYLTNANSNSVQSYSIQNTGELILSGTLNTGFLYAHSIRCDPTGKYVYATMYNSATMQSYVIEQTTGVLTITGSISTNTGPISIGIDQKKRGFVYVPPGDTSVTKTLQTFTTSNGFQYLGTSSVSVATPFIVKGDNLGKWLYVGGSVSNVGLLQAYTVNQTTGALTATGALLTLTSTNNVVDIVIDKSNRFLYAIVSSDTYPQIYAYTINQSTGALTFVGSYGPVGVSSGYLFSTIDLSGEYFIFADQILGQPTYVKVFSIEQTTGALTYYNAYFGAPSQLAMIPNKSRYVAAALPNYGGIGMTALALVQSDYSTSISSDTKKINTKNKLPHDVKERITDPIKRNPAYWGN